MKKFTKLAMAVAITAATSFSAFAAPVTEFYFSQSAGLVAPSYTNADRYNFSQSAETLGSDYVVGAYSTLSWVGTNGIATVGGDTNPANNPSSLTVTSFNSTTSASQDGAWNENEAWIITNLHHRNNEILPNEGSTYTNPLWIADIVANLRIFSDAVDGNLVDQDLASTNTIAFNETPNQGGNVANCSGSNPHSTACDDVYTDMTLSAFAPRYFFYDGTEYELSFGLLAGDGAIIEITDFLRVYTAETFPGDSDVYVTMAWRAVPEPGSLALAGLGLTALAALRRRKSMAV